MKILLAQLNPIIGDLAGNAKKILDTLDAARKKQVDIVLFSELVLTGYPPEDLVLHKDFIGKVESYLDHIIQHTKDLTVCLGLPRKSDIDKEKRLCNSVAIIQDCKLVDFYDKWLLPTYDVFDESRYFASGTQPCLFEVAGKKVAVVICEDIWAESITDTQYAKDPIETLIPYKPDLLLNLSASPYHFQKTEVRVQVCQKTARRLSCPVLLCCQVGGNDQLLFDGYSVVVNSKAELTHLGRGFAEDFIYVDLASSSPSLPFLYDPLEDLYDALVLGVRDYFHKSGFKKACVGLSGGIDSALVAAIGVKALGKENVLAVALPSRYSSAGSVTDARELAKQLDIALREVSIEGPFEAFESLFFENKHPLKGLAEENIQARIRGAILMGISNQEGCVVLSTGNKSELSVGYCTLYGDMCGGLSVIGDVTKNQVYRLAEWIHRKTGIIPRSIIEKPPSAELRPNQKDTDSLPDYGILDAVIEGYVEDLLSPEEIAHRTGISLSLVENLICRIHAAEYKRRQSAPMIRVSKKALRAGRRYPIVQKWMI